MLTKKMETFLQKINEGSQSGINNPLKSYNVFENSSVYINIKHLFYAYYQQIPNFKGINNLDCNKLSDAIETEKGDEVLRVHYRQEYSKRSEEMVFVDLIYFMKDGVVINLEDDSIMIAFEPKNETVAQQWIDWIMKFRDKKKPTTNEICLVTSSLEGFKTTALKLKKPNLKIAENYNDDMIETHNIIVKKLRQKNAAGLFLFHGIPGTGKSTYIKFLIHQLNKKVIFMSPKLAGNLDAPELMNFLIKNSDAIIVIEDGEELITTREGNRNSSISTLLNLTDGLLGECLNIQIIATFNTKIANIDRALLRKGRLQMLYEFKELSYIKANNLLSKIGINNFYNMKDMTLADIYNTKENEYEFRKERAPIGFIQK